MTEGLRAVIDHGHRGFGLDRIEVWTFPGHATSARVLEKAGFRYEGTLREKGRFNGKFHDFRMFGRVADDPMTDRFRPAGRHRSGLVSRPSITKARNSYSSSCSALMIRNPCCRQIALPPHFTTPRKITYARIVPLPIRFRQGRN
jgi:hypothetical protein